MKPEPRMFIDVWPPFSPMLGDVWICRGEKRVWGGPGPGYNWDPPWHPPMPVEKMSGYPRRPRRRKRNGPVSIEEKRDG